MRCRLCMVDCDDECACSCHYSYKSWLAVGLFNALFVLALFLASWYLRR